MGKDKKQTTTQTLDPSSQRFVDQMRRQAGMDASAIGGMGPITLGPDSRSIMEQIQPFMDPFMDQVIGGVRGEFDHLRAGASRDSAQGATAAGAFGSSRHGVLEGTRLGELDRAQTSQVGGLLSSGFQNALTQGLQHSEYKRALNERVAREPITRAQFRQQLMAGGLGPTGMSQTQTQHGNLFGDIAGLGLTGLGLMAGGPAGAAAGASAGFGGGGNPMTGFGGTNMPNSSIFSPNWRPPTFGRPR